MYAALESRLAAAQNAAVVRENEQSAMDAATVEERFELRERLKETERALEIAVDDCYASPQGQVERYVQKARAELAKEKANG
jgi:hypothetical protein